MKKSYEARRAKRKAKGKGGRSWKLARLPVEVRKFFINSISGSPTHALKGDRAGLAACRIKTRCVVNYRSEYVRPVLSSQACIWLRTIAPVFYVFHLAPCTGAKPKLANDSS